jgi:hypothetical protein
MNPSSVLHPQGDHGFLYEWYTDSDDGVPEDAYNTVASYPLEIERRVVFSEHSVMQPVQASLEAAFDTTPTATLGDLGRLPVEILMMILRHMNIRTFFRFRQVNLRVRELSAAIKEYETIAKYALGAVRALLRTNLAGGTVNSLYQELQSDRCKTCHGFGGLLFLLTAQRCCFNCLLHSSRYHVMGLDEFYNSANVTREALRHRPVLRTVSGKYDEKCQHRPSHLILVGKTSTALFKAGVIDKSTRQKLARRKSPKEYRSMTATPFPSYDPKTDKLDRGVCCGGCRFRLENMSGSELDLDHTSGDEMDELDGFRWVEFIDVLSREEFNSHYMECDEAQGMWWDSIN